MNKKTKLELTWIGKDEMPRLEPRILIENKDFSYHANFKCGENDIYENKLIYGDNLLALKAIEQDYSGKIKCVFIDPPYNTGSAFTHYDDGVEHSIWLSLMRDRLLIINKLLSDEGSLWIAIDDNEVHYLKVLCDEIFGRKNFVTTFVWEKDKGRRNDTDISSAHDHILLYVKDREKWKTVRNLLPRTEAQNERYKNPDNDPRGPWLQGDNGTAKSGSESLLYPIQLPSGRIVTPPKGNYWRFSKKNFELALQEKRVYFGRSGDSMPVIKRYLSEVKDGVVPRTWWTAEDAGSNQSAKRDHLRKLLPDIEPFSTPKPEELVSLILQIATNPGDIVLDSFAGSGTTGAVAHKMGRKWIMIELGEHCHTHIIPRLKKVIDGTDSGGISKKLNWQGGGGFRYYRLAPSLLEKDKFGNWIINKEYNAPMLAEAMCKHHGFTYDPDESVYWKQGWSTETDYIYTTTQLMTRELATRIHDSLGENETVLICCKAYNLNEADFPNITFQKIPASILNRCEFGKDDYSLNVAQLPPLEKAEQLELFSEGEEL